MSQMKMADDKIIEGDVDLISTLPDVILQDILCFIPTKLAITTSLLSRRWRHVWCDMPCISLDVDTLTAASIIYVLSVNSLQLLCVQVLLESSPFLEVQMI
ncbi:hypothetical protein F2Q70_00023091 [Brassica cretica]|uniref:F-box domain-containing protein n=1 Tax=Brassica cretica TaxID=69181 RepID=A0A8S9GLB9_BRACR|nr:hypothetical protein F2Q70_00023091 [Brassica cretica]